MHLREISLTLGVALVLGVGGGVLYRSHQNSLPLYTTGSDVPDAAQSGSVGQSIAKAKELLATYNRVDGNLEKIPFPLMTLPDQRLAENPANRATNMTAWFFPSPHLYKDVAFYTDIYCRQNRSYYKGDKSKAKPNGFLIVVWKNGKIEQIPVEQMRLIASEGKRMLGFPGLPGYETGQPDPMYSRK